MAERHRRAHWQPRCLRRFDPSVAAIPSLDRPDRPLAPDVNFFSMTTVQTIPLLTMRERRGGPLPAFMNCDVLTAIVETIERGAWDYIAAEAAGVPKTTFEGWMRRGREDAAAERDTEFSRFSGLVAQARARARARAEVAVAEMRSDLWLTKGPGRERAGREGWGTQSSPANEQQGPIRVTFDIAAASGEPNDIAPDDEAEC
jgi:hypothetical protein